MNRWQRTAAALARLAEDQKGKPEGDVARKKLQQVLENHPEARSSPRVVAFMERDLSMADVYRMRRAGVDTDGSWIGHNLQDAVRKMQDDLTDRVAASMERMVREAMGRAFAVDAEIMGTASHAEVVQDLRKRRRDVRVHHAWTIANDVTSSE